MPIVTGSVSNNTSCPTATSKYVFENSQFWIPSKHNLVGYLNTISK